MEKYCYRAAAFCNDILDTETWINQQTLDGFRVHTFVQSEDESAIHYTVLMEKQ